MTDSLIRRFDIAAQHNILVHAPLNLNGTESRLFTLALGCIHKNDEELPRIRIRFTDVFETDSGSNYEVLEKACEGLMSKVVKLRAVNGKHKQTKMYSIISFMQLDSGTGLIEGTFAQEIAPYLLDLTKNFTLMQVNSLLTLKSPHSRRLVWLLQSEEHKGGWEVSLDELRLQLFAEEAETAYTDYYDFKRWLLRPVMEEINDKEGMNWEVKMEEVKAGLRRVTGLRFTIPEFPPQPGVGGKLKKKAKPALPPATPASTAATPVPAASVPQMRVNKDESAPLRKLLAAATPAPRSSAVFEEYLAGVDKRLQTAYARMIAKDGDHIEVSVAQRIIKHVAGSENMTALLLKARYEVAGAKLADKPTGTTRASFIVNTMKAIGL